MKKERVPKKIHGSASKRGSFLEPIGLLFFAVAVFFLFSAMASSHKYDKPKKEEPSKKPSGAQYLVQPVKGIATGVKKAAFEGTSEFLGTTVEKTREEPPLLGTLEGVRQGTGKLLDQTIKGTAKVATLGYADVENYEVQEPEAGTDKPTKVTFKF